MKKRFGIYSFIWAIVLGLFNAIVFAAPITIGVSFWVGYAFITAAFLLQLLFAHRMSKESQPKQMLLRLCMVWIGGVGLSLMLIAGILTMTLSTLPIWIGAMACALVLLLTVTAAAGVFIAFEGALESEERGRERTVFMKEITAKAKSLAQSLPSGPIAKEAERIYEALRYSDPVANPSLADSDRQIKGQFAAFAEAAYSEDDELAAATAKELLNMIGKRNELCREMKGGKA